LQKELAEEKPLAYPVYTLSTAIVCLVNENDGSEKIEPLVARLRAYQFTPERGWTGEDKSLGGWGYNKQPMKKGDVGILDANLSATVYALRGLRAAGVAVDDAAIVQGLDFVRRCQNYTPRSHVGPAWDDGGFFFSPVCVERNKAGERDDINGHYRSYGAMTADGIRALAYCGISELRGARDWMLAHFAVDVQPGEFPEIKRSYQHGMYYYYLASLAEAATLYPNCAPQDWRKKMSEAILQKQNADGSWTNRFTDGREDDPVVGTMHAALALTICRE
jgi:hypothetical protein